MSGDGGSDFLYPFIDSSERDARPLLADLARSAAGKAEASRARRLATLERTAGDLAAAADAMAARFAAGGRLFTFGNGGSAADAATAAALFASPPWGEARPARSLAEDPTVLSALGNDVGFDLVFARQLIAHAEPGDVALALSTSGTSRNVLAGLEEAAARGLLTIGVAGYDGGAMAQAAAVAHCLVVRSDSVHRIQEAQASLVFALWCAVEERGRARG